MLFIHRLLLLLVSFPLWTNVCIARPATADLSHFELPNGLQLYVLKDHRAPLAVTQMWYRVGSADEGMGQAGLSHMLEHMAFKGTHRFPGNSASELIARLGGIENAFTSRDYTVYHYQIAAERVATALQIEAERMTSLQFDADQFTAERQVVLEERQRNVEDRPNAVFFEQFFLHAYATSPYRQPIIGWPEDIRSWTITTIEAWYRQWYTPANAILVVAGDVDPNAIHTQVKSLFGTDSKRPAPALTRRSEPKRSISRQFEITLPAQLPFLVMGFRAPSLLSVLPDDQADVYALMVLSAILSEGQSARLHNSLVREQRIASLVGTSFDPLLREDAIFFWFGQPAESSSFSELEAAFRDQIALLQTQPVDPVDLERIKTRVTAMAVYERDTVFERALEIGQLATLGLDLSLIDDFASHIQAVTPEALMRVVQRYLTPDRVTVARLVPELPAVPLAARKSTELPSP